MSYFKDQDGRLSQVTSFYRSTPQTNTLPSRARQKEALLRSTGKLAHQRCFPHKPRLSCLLALKTLHSKKNQNYHCLIACESSMLLSWQWKRLLIVVIAIDLSSEHKCWREIRCHPTKRQASKSGCLIERPFLTEQGLSVMSCDVGWCGWWICQHLIVNFINSEI